MEKLILVVEDEKDIRNDIARFLKLNSFRTISAANGRIALDLAIKHMPDLIISDIMMPEVDGFQLLQMLHEHEETKTIPFLFLSARSDRPDIREGMNLGADDYITKPFDFDELLESVQSRLKKRDVADRQFNEKFEELRTNIRNSLPQEIRNPLNAILGFSEIMLKNFDSTDSVRMKEMLTDIHSSGERLNKIFENYILYTQLETSKSDEIDSLSAETPSAKELLSELSFDTAKKYNRSADLQLDIEEATLAIPQEYFAKIIEEIVDNCFKYSYKLSLVLISSKRFKDKYKLIFTDYGRGMSTQQVKNIGAYVQFERRIHEQEGMGLGLAIVKKIVELYGGAFSIKSDPGEFTIVMISLPCK